MMLDRDFYPADFDPAALNVLGFALAGGHASGALKQGYAWNFADGDILATKTGGRYNAAEDYYDNASLSSDVCSGGTVTASTAQTGWEAVQAFDKVISTAWASTNAPPQHVTYCLEEARKVGAYTLQAYTQQVYMPSAWSFLGSNNGSDWDTLDTRTGITFSASEKKTFTISTPDVYLYYRLNVTSGGAQVIIPEIEMLGVTVNDATLIPTAVSVASAPSRMTAYFLVDPVDAITLGTDLKIRVSRDDGATWSGFGSVAEVAAYDASYNLVKADFPASALAASGALIKWELTTSNEKEIRVRAAALFVE